MRIIAATNKDLKELVREGIFRDDLFYRLNVLDIVLPPLRDRESDIPILIQHFLKIFGIKFGKEGLHLSQEAEVLLFTYDFPGNVRELENIIQRAVVLTEGEIIETSHLPKDFYRKGAAVYHKVEHPNFKAAKQHVIEQFENEYIIDCLRSAQGNISSASRNAGMNIKNFHHKMVKYGINPQSFKKTE
ncbi:MAG: sigma 54-interacting transcriptional regulator [Candidatus Scalindua sp.]|nr:sigma 54-interacting transcriptional regulator [Candidatus Scalindua sp.]